MTKRSLNTRFRQPVLDDIKFTTIRDKLWPVGVPIMLYSWTDKPYRSKHHDLCPVKVTGYWPIWIEHNPGGGMSYTFGMEHAKPLWETEGFASQENMDAWFRVIVKPGTTATKYLMRFRRVPLAQG